MESVKVKKASGLSAASRPTAADRDEDDDEGRSGCGRRSPAELDPLNKARKSGSSLLLRRRKVRRHVSSISRSLDRQTLLRHRSSPQLQLPDRQWVRQDLRRGSVHVHDRLTVWSQPRPVLCTVESTAAEIAHRLQQTNGRTGSVLRLTSKICGSTDVNGNCDGEYPLRHLHRETDSLPDRPSDRLRLLLLEKDQRYQQEYDISLYSSSGMSVERVSPQDEDSVKRFTGSDVESSSACDELSAGARFAQHRDSLSDDMVLGTDASALSPAFDSSATEGLDTYGSSSDELELDCPSEPLLQDASTFSTDSNNIAADDPYQDLSDETEPAHRTLKALDIGPADSLGAGLIGDGPDPDGQLAADGAGTTASDSDSSPALYVQLHGEAARRLSPDERPLQIQNDFLFKLGFKDPWRVQEEGMNTELGSLLRFYAVIPQGFPMDHTPPSPSHTHTHSHTVTLTHTGLFLFSFTSSNAFKLLGCGNWPDL